MKPKGKAKPKAEPVAKALPPGAEGLMDKADVCTALRCGERKLDEMLSTGEYPSCDLRIGDRPRWRVGTHNRWIEEQAEQAKR
jgi:hypothetical protein